MEIVMGENMYAKKRLIQEARRHLGEFTLSEKCLTAGSVAAALITNDGNIHTGICIDLACGIGFCAEHSAIAEMLKHRETRIQMIVAVSEGGILPPCGRCRELMMQLNEENRQTKVVVAEDKVIALQKLLPHPWR